MSERSIPPATAGDRAPVVNGEGAPLKLPLSARVQGRGAGWMRARDCEIVRWIGRLGAVTVDHVIAHFEIGRTMAYERIAACVAAGLLERVAVVHLAPAFLVATRAGLRFAGLGLPAVCVSPALANHHRVCADVALWLERRYGHDRVMSVRELAFEERSAGRPIASAKLGELASGAARLHRPDFAVLGDRKVAVEVELTPKAPGRLERIVRAWRRARCVDQVDYLCAAGAARRGVERAVTATRSEQAVRVIGLEELLG